MSVRTNWVEKDFAFLTGAATFLTRDDCLDRSHIIKLDPLPQWKQIATSLAASSTDPWTRIATSFDDLVDSPIVMGELDIRSFECGGVPHYLATLGGDKFWDSEKALADVQKIVAKEQEFWGEVPYKSYWFLNLATEQGGGLEHDNSTVLMTSRFATKDKAKYQNWLGLVSHEFFHTWNVRRLRPKSLVNYDYDREQYFRELWVAEGVTSYYDDLFLPRAGLCTPTEYLDRLNKTVADVQKSPGRKVQSLFDSSFDAWTKYYRPDENAKNSRVSYYTKGSLVGLLLDVEIRRATGNAKSLDDVMRKLWSEHRITGYTNDDVVRICCEISGQDLQPWFKDCLETTKELNFQPLLDFYGLEWKDSTVKESTATEPAFVGLTLNNQAGKAMVATVPIDTPAAEAGFNVGDEWIGLNNLRITPENWNEMVGYFHAGDDCECLIARHGKLVTLKMTLGTKPRESWTLKRIEKPSELQEANWKNWLGIQPEPQPASESAAASK
jgi:predicted metalloprotease with PDZ domain